jgi:hypothetical protein
MVRDQYCPQQRPQICRCPHYDAQQVGPGTTAFGRAWPPTVCIMEVERPLQKKLFSQATIWLWLLLAIVLILYLGKAVGVEWNLPPTRAFGRLLSEPTVAALEVVLALGLLLVVFLSRSKPDWKVVGLSVIAIALSLYHMLEFLIGVEFLLLWSSGALVREYCRNA